MFSIIQLWQDLHRNFEFKYLLTKQLNQDPLENLFAVLRQMGGCKDNPQANQWAMSLTEQ